MRSSIQGECDADHQSRLFRARLAVVTLAFLVAALVAVTFVFMDRLQLESTGEDLLALLQAEAALVEAMAKHDRGVYPDPEAARQSFMLLLDQYPGNAKEPDALYKLGRVHYIKGNRDRSREFLDRVIRQYPESSAAGLAKEFIQQNLWAVGP